MINKKLPDNKKMFEDYLAYASTKDEAYAWAWNEIDKSVSHPEGLAIVVELIQACQSDKEIAYVAAGPLEDLIIRNLEKIEPELTVLVRQNEKMRKAICGVWATDGSAARKVLDRILNKFGLIYGSF